MSAHYLELAQIVRDGLGQTYDEDYSEAGRSDAARALAEIINRLEHAETEIAYTRMRGDHLIYAREWEAFDAWQRNARRWNQQRAHRAIKVREAAEATPAGNPIWKVWALDLADDVHWLVNESYTPADVTTA